MKTTAILVFFIIACLFQIYSCIPPMHTSLRSATKLLLMPLLALWLIFALEHPPKLIVAGLFLGFLGDLLLLSGKTHTKSFILGGLCFGAGHILYGTYFVEHLGPNVSRFAIIAAILVYAMLLGFFVSRLRSNMSRKLLAALISYFFVISFMSISALLYMTSHTGFAYCIPFIGSLMFILSDGFLSFDKFRRKIKYRYLLVMITYILAQSGIAFGIYLTVS